MDLGCDGSKPGTAIPSYRRGGRVDGAHRPFAVQLLDVVRRQPETPGDGEQEVAVHRVETKRGERHRQRSVDVDRHRVARVTADPVGQGPHRGLKCRCPRGCRNLQEGALRGGRGGASGARCREGADRRHVRWRTPRLPSSSRSPSVGAPARIRIARLTTAPWRSLKARMPPARPLMGAARVEAIVRVTRAEGDSGP